MGQAKKAFAAIILAAGEGKRMRSPLPKVLHALDGRPMIDWVIDAARKAGSERIVVVVGKGREQVEAVLPAGVETVLQSEQLGTGHAARCAEEKLLGYDGPVVVLCGDVPLIRAQTIARLVERQTHEQAAAVVLSARVSGSHAYGRIVRNECGDVTSIVEDRDCTAQQKTIDEINSGTYAFASGALFPALRRLRGDNAQGEFYLTDTIGLFVADGRRVLAEVAPRFDECQGVNTPEELSAAALLLASRSDYCPNQGERHAAT